jgi:two-component system, NtrC family, sensor kinase
MKVFLKAILLLLLPLLSVGQQENPHLNRLYRSLTVATSDTARMQIFSKLGSYYILEDRDSANFYLEKALPIAVKLNLKFDEASILNKMGIILMQQENFSKSLEFYLKALNIAKDPTIEKNIVNLSPGQTPRSARLLEMSNSYDLIGLLNAYTGNWIGNIQNQMKNYREAEKYAKAAGDTRQIAYINFHMGIAYMNERKLDSALMLIKNAISTFSDLNDQSGLGRAMKYLGDAYARMGNFNLAANTLLQSLALLKETNDYVHIGLTYLSLNDVYTDLKKSDSALYYAKESLKIFEKRNDPVGKKDAYNLLTSHFNQLGKTDSATMYLKMAKTLSDSLSEEARKNLLAFQDVVVEEQVKLEKLEKEKIQTNNKIRTYSMIAGLVILSLIGLILYRNNKKEKKAKIVLEKTLNELKSTQSQLIQSEKMASLGELTAGIAHEIQNPLNFVNNFSEVNTELIEELKAELTTGNLQEAIVIADDIKENEQKISHHGKRADAIVKGMLQHSRSNSGNKEPTDINALADEYLRLAYHGLRAKDNSFNATLKTNYDDNIGKINVVPQDMGRVILNLITNAFYAVNERSLIAKDSGDTSYEPTVWLRTKKTGNQILISIKDNGSGISQKMLDKIFQPFFTTKPTGEGTGLGLSLSYDIVKVHGGELKVETKEGEGSEFIILLPVEVSTKANI